MIQTTRDLLFLEGEREVGEMREGVMRELSVMPPSRSLYIRCLKPLSAYSPEPGDGRARSHMRAEAVAVGNGRGCHPQAVGSGASFARRARAGRQGRVCTVRSARLAWRRGAWTTCPGGEAMLRCLVLRL